MADELRMALAEVLRKAGVQEADFLREGVRVLAQELMALELAEHVGAERHERTPERSGYRNGYRERPWDTRVGSIELRVPRVRDGSFFPSLLEPRRRAERALVAVVQEAYVQGISTRRVDDLVQALGMRGISKSQVSRLCAELDREVERFRTRQLAGPYPYVWLDVGPSESGAFWLAFLRDLVARGLNGVKLVTSDAHAGLKTAIGSVLQGASWQRCRVHFMRDALGLVPKSAQQMVAATIRTVFAQPDGAAAREQWRRVADTFRPRFGRLAELLDAAEADVLAYAG